VIGKAFFFISLSFSCLLDLVGCFFKGSFFSPTLKASLLLFPLIPFHRSGGDMRFFRYLFSLENWLSSVIRNLYGIRVFDALLFSIPLPHQIALPDPQTLSDLYLTEREV